MRCTSVRLLTAAAILTLGLLPLMAQDQPKQDLERVPEGYKHTSSGSWFAAPKDWELRPPQMVGMISYLGLHRKSATVIDRDVIDVMVSWSPLGKVKIDEAAKLEQRLLTQVYGEGKVVELKDPPLANGKTGYGFTIAEGPTVSGREAGVVYLFQSGPDDKAWKVKIRATFPGATEQEKERKLLEEKSREAVRQLLEQLHL